MSVEVKGIVKTITLKGLYKEDRFDIGYGSIFDNARIKQLQSDRLPKAAGSTHELLDRCQTAGARSAFYRPVAILDDYLLFFG